MTLTFGRLEEVQPGHWRVVVDQAPTVPVRRTFELWCPTDVTELELDQVLVQVKECLRRRRAGAETP